MNAPRKEKMPAAGRKNGSPQRQDVLRVSCEASWPVSISFLCRRTLMIKYLTAALLGAAVLLAGCNTMAGMGKDIKAGGEKLEKAADR